MKKAYCSALSSATRKALKKIKAADIIVGISSFNNAHTINYVVHQAAKALETYFPERKSVIFVSDGGSTDGTLDVVNAIRLPSKAQLVSTTYVGVSGKGSAVKAIFEAAQLLEAEAVALLDSDLRSITPDWVKLLLSPIFAGAGFVAPLYVRHKYDGTITNFLCYPLTSSLYGKEIRQPIGGDFGLSIEFVQTLLESPLWRTPYVPRFGIDIFETHTALAKEFKVKQAFLGTKIHEPKDPSKHLASMFREVVGSMFTCVENYETSWKKVSGFQKVETVGEKKAFGTPEPVSVDLRNIMETYKKGFENYKKFYQTILPQDLFNKVEKLRKAKPEEFSLSSEAWAKIVYSFLVGFKRCKQFEREYVLDALRVLWIGKVGAFVKEALKLDDFEAERKIRQEMETFRKLRNYLIELY